MDRLKSEERDGAIVAANDFKNQDEIPSGPVEDDGSSSDRKILDHLRYLSQRCQSVQVY